MSESNAVLTVADELKQSLVALIMGVSVIVAWLLIGPALGMDADKLIVGSFGYLACRAYIASVWK